MMPGRRVGLALACAAAIGISGGIAVAHAEPATPTTLTYLFTACSGPDGALPDFEAVKQPGGAAALHLTDGTGNFVVTSAIDALTGATLFATPGFSRNGLPVITCDSVHPVTQREAFVSGFLTPADQH